MENMKGKQGFMMLKLDLEKAYDRLEWGFVMETLEKLGIPRGLCAVGKVTNDFLRKLMMEDVKPMATPMHPSMVIVKDEKGKPVSKKEYRGMIGSLLYLIASIPNCILSWSMCQISICSKRISYNCC